MFRCLFAALLVSISAPGLAREPLPIIDMHYHAAWPASDDAAELRSTLDEMDKHGIVLSALHINEPSDVADWVIAAPGRFVAGPMFPCDPFDAQGKRDCFRATNGWPDLKWLEDGFASGTLGMMGEMLFVYHGTAPDDQRMEPYWTLAEKYDIPVAVHINRGPPPGASPRYEGCCPNFNADYGNPALLRPVLKRHPKLRIQLQHVGIPARPVFDGIDYLYETIALMRDHPNVYAEMSITNSIFDEEMHSAALKRIVEAGLLQRVMFATDNMPVEPILARLERFDFLSGAQRRDILYNNAARFLRLDEGTIARHHERAKKQQPSSD